MLLIEGGEKDHKKWIVRLLDRLKKTNAWGGGSGEFLAPRSTWGLGNGASVPGSCVGNRVGRSKGGELLYISAIRPGSRPPEARNHDSIY